MTLRVNFFQGKTNAAGVPSLSNQLTLANVAGTNVDAIAFDVANNLYFASASQECFFAYSTPKANNSHLTPAPKASVIVVDGMNVGLENVGEMNNARKFFHNGQIYIERDGVVYTVTGVRMK